MINTYTSLLIRLHLDLRKLIKYSPALCITTIDVFNTPIIIVNNTFPYYNNNVSHTTHARG